MQLIHVIRISGIIFGFFGMGIGVIWYTIKSIYACCQTINYCSSISPLCALIARVRLIQNWRTNTVYENCERFYFIDMIKNTSLVAFNTLMAIPYAPTKLQIYEKSNIASDFSLSYRIWAAELGTMHVLTHACTLQVPNMYYRRRPKYGEHAWDYVITLWRHNLGTTFLVFHVYEKRICSMIH